jgi:hypothetical protein
MPKIMLMRHAEKPSERGSIGGVDEAGNADENELSVTGWQRAGALARLFAEVDAERGSPLARPSALYAPTVSAESPSKRCEHTLLPLARLLRLQIDTSFAKQDTATLAIELRKDPGPILVCWEHKALPSIIEAICARRTIAPAAWPEDRFDVVWLLERGEQGWAFSQIPQLLLAGDRHDPI